MKDIYPIENEGLKKKGKLSKLFFKKTIPRKKTSFFKKILGKLKFNSKLAKKKIDELANVKGGTKEKLFFDIKGEPTHAQPNLKFKQRKFFTNLKSKLKNKISQSKKIFEIKESKAKFKKAPQPKQKIPLIKKLFSPIEEKPKILPKATPKTQTHLRKAIGTPLKEKKYLNYFLPLLAFVMASILMGGYFFRENMKNLALNLINNLTNKIANPQKNIKESQTPLPKIEVEAPKIPLAYYVVQKQEKAYLKTFNSEKEETLFSFLPQSILKEESVALGKEYFAFIDKDGLKIYHLKEKEEDLILTSTNISRITKVRISPNEKFLAFLVIKEAQPSVYLYSFREKRILEGSFTATLFTFNSKNQLLYSYGNALFLYDLDKNESLKITEFEKPVLGLFAQNNDNFIVTGEKKTITLWQLNEEQSCTNISNLQLVFDFNIEDFGLAKKEDTLYVSLSGETLAIDLKTKTKKEYIFSVSVYKLLNYIKEKDYFVALKKTSALRETSLIIFKDKEIIFESPIEEKIIFIK